MVKKIRKNSVHRMLLLYAVIYGGCLFCAPGYVLYCFAEEPVADEESLIGALKNPFSLKEQVPELFKFFMKGLEEIKKKEAVVAQERKAPVPAKVEKPLLPVPVVLVVPQIPSMSVTGVVYAGNNSQAIINGQVVGQGDVVDGVKILGISKGRIDIRHMDIDHVIYFSND